jgi:hypothetical protein
MFSPSLIIQSSSFYITISPLRSTYKNRKYSFFRAEGMVYVVEYLPRKHRVLSSNPNTEKKRERKYFFFNKFLFSLQWSRPLNLHTKGYSSIRAKCV